jgi:hypothetical protein
MAFIFGAHGFNFNWQGQWLTGSLYFVGDAVFSAGSSYVCVQSHAASPGNAPPSASFWSALVAQGPTGPMPPVVQAPADITNSTVTLADATGLAFPVASSNDYYFEFAVTFRSAALNTGITLAVNGPAAPTSIVTMTDISTSLAARVLGAARAYNGTVGSTVIDTANADTMAFVSGVLRNGATAGALVLRFASSRGGTLVTVRAGSVVRYHQLN